MKKTLFAIPFTMAALAASASWNGLTEGNHIHGPKVTADDLKGKVVLVEGWGVNCAPCRASLPKMEKLWQKYMGRPFVLIGSHLQQRDNAKIIDLVKANKLTYSIYDHANWNPKPDTGPGIPHAYLIDHRGNVVYVANRGIDEGVLDAEIAKAVKAIGAAPSLLGGYTIPTTCASVKSLEKQIVFGKDPKSVIPKLERIVKQAEKKTANAKDKEAAEVATEVLKRIENAKQLIKRDIEEADPDDAYDWAKLYVRTFPTEGEEYKDKLTEMAAKAKEFKATKPKESKDSKSGAKAGAKK